MKNRISRYRAADWVKLLVKSKIVDAEHGSRVAAGIAAGIRCGHPPWKQSCGSGSSRKAAED